jgi:hypothetical protein
MLIEKVDSLKNNKVMFGHLKIGDCFVTLDDSYSPYIKITDSNGFPLGISLKTGRFNGMLGTTPVQKVTGKFTYSIDNS